MNRIQVRAQVLSCTECELSDRCSAPVPFDGPSPAELAVIGEAPGKMEDEAGRPFVGPSGELLRESLKRTGFDPDAVFYMSAASCFPTDPDGKGRAPADAEVKACAENLRAQMDLSGAKFFVLTGGVPLKAVRPGLKIGKARGVPFYLDATRTDMGERIGVATYHPSYIVRSGGLGSKQHGMMMEDLRFVRDLMEAPPDERFRLFPESCLECGEYGERWDDDGIGWCAAHWRGK